MKCSKWRRCVNVNCCKFKFWVKTMCDSSLCQACMDFCGDRKKKKKPDQTHAVYTHCCSTHDQHQGSQTTLLHRGRKGRVQWQQQVLKEHTAGKRHRNNSFIDIIVWVNTGLFNLTTLIEELQVGGDDLWVMHTRKRKDPINEKETISPESECRIGKRW